MQDIACDVLVVGAGGGGAAAAVVAARTGAHVVVVDKEVRPGGNTALSSGSVPAAGTRMQRAAGIEDHPRWLVEDILEQSGGQAPRRLVEALAEASSQLVEWLHDEVGVEMEIIASHRHVGHRVPRLHAPASRSGDTLLRGLLRAARSAGADVVMGRRVCGLLVEGGRVSGVRVAPAAGDTEETLRASSVILASGGFGADRELLRRHCPEIAESPYFGAASMTGDALEWGAATGAVTRAMSSYTGHASSAHPHGSLLSWTAMEKGGVLLDAEGRRFCDEQQGYSACTGAVLRHAGGRALAVYDQGIHDQLLSMPSYRELVEAGAVTSHADVGSLARSFGERDRSTRRSATPDVSTLSAPYFSVRVEAGLIQTQGGWAVDEHGRVLDGHGEPVPGLYAVGGAAAGLAGDAGSDGYTSGSGLLMALGLGMLVGRHAGGASA